MINPLKIVYKSKNVIIINKPIGMPSQKDPSGDLDAMTAASEILTANGEDGNLWLVHRLDRTVGGLLAFARNKKTAAELSKIVSGGTMGKNYLAVCHGEAKEGEYKDFLFKDNATSKAYIVKSERKGAKEARLTVDLLNFAEDKSLISVTLDTGRFHQIRAQLSARGNSLVGEKKYGSRDADRKTPALFANKLSFKLFGKEITVTAIPNIEEYPWNLFAIENYKKASTKE